jgi:hypothetical protein
LSERHRIRTSAKPRGAGSGTTAPRDSWQVKRFRSDERRRLPLARRSQKPSRSATEIFQAEASISTMSRAAKSVVYIKSTKSAKSVCVRTMAVFNMVWL